ncbi:MAG: hypothetical protein REI78_04260 [Pedobacter sp.]|nr:hypothetical protein [Pedobacter sp.]MDQ8052212.1 hypothetical protein [Pedobacter sp.]
MNYPVFIFHELVLRFWEINHGIGRYISSTIDNGECLIRTTSGIIKISLGMLEKQYRNPGQISKEELQLLAEHFQFRS